MEAVIETRVLGSRFWLQGADGEALQRKGRRQKAEGGMRSLTTDHGLTQMGTKLGTRGDARPPYPWNPRQPWLHFAESGLRSAECRKDELGMQELKG
jgi:hypothetical protein